MVPAMINGWLINTGGYNWITELLEEQNFILKEIFISPAFAITITQMVCGQLIPLVARSANVCCLLWCPFSGVFLQKTVALSILKFRSLQSQVIYVSMLFPYWINMFLSTKYTGIQKSTEPEFRSPASAGGREGQPLTLVSESLCKRVCIVCRTVLQNYHVICHVSVGPVIFQLAKLSVVQNLISFDYIMMNQCLIIPSHMIECCTSAVCC